MAVSTRVLFAKSLLVVLSLLSAVFNSQGLAEVLSSNDAAASEQLSLPPHKQLSNITSSTQQDHAIVSHQRQLPVRNENGIIIVYIHIPKTGGTSLRKPFYKWGRIFFTWGRQQYDAKIREMTEKLENWKKGDFAFFELHGGSAAPFMEFRHVLQQWRATAKAQDIPMFAFTIVREPLSFSVSYYTFYHTQHIKGFKQFPETDFNEQNLLDHAMPSPQCMALTRTENAYRDQALCEQCQKCNYACGEPLRQNFTQHECLDAYEAMRNDLDWIGLTSKLSTETFPLLNAVFNRTVKFPTLNSSGRKVHKSQLSPRAVKQLQNMTVGDSEIHRRTMRDFPIAMWESCQSPAPAEAAKQ